MKITGLIAEFNPFHNGHAKLINHIKSNSNTAVIAIISGNFVQRGEPAIFDKFIRCRHALLSGVDLVIELPVCYSLQSAEGFAFGGTSILNAAGADEIVFGSECGNINILTEIAETSLDNSEAINNEIKTKLKEGIPYGKAKYAAECRFCPNAEILSSPNNLLAVEYIKAILSNEMNMAFSTIKREKENTENPSAKKIRSLILDNGNYTELIPYSLSEEINMQPVTLDSFYQTISYIIRSSEAKSLAEIQGVSEGFENKLKEVIYNSTDLNSLIINTCSKRYTETRIKRILCSVLLNITNKIIAESKKQSNMYARILGFRKEKTSIISELSERSVIPLITKAADLNEDNPLIKKDILATDLYYLATRQKGRQDFSQKLITL